MDLKSKISNPDSYIMHPEPVETACHVITANTLKMQKYPSTYFHLLSPLNSAQIAMKKHTMHSQKQKPPPTYNTTAIYPAEIATRNIEKAKHRISQLNPTTTVSTAIAPTTNQDQYTYEPTSPTKTSPL